MTLGKLIDDIVSESTISLIQMAIVAKQFEGIEPNIIYLGRNQRRDLSMLVESQNNNETMPVGIDINIQQREVTRVSNLKVVWVEEEDHLEVYKQ